MDITLWSEELINSIDSKDATKFANFFAKDGSFIFGNFPAVTGKGNIKDFVNSFFDSVKSLKHNQLGIMQDNNKIVVWGVVTYTRHNGTEYPVKFCNVFDMDGDKIKTYDVYVDNSQLYVE